MPNRNKITNPRPYSHVCKRCGHEWFGFVPVPKNCGSQKCRSQYWNHPDAVPCESGSRLQVADKEEQKRIKKENDAKRREAGYFSNYNRQRRKEKAAEIAAYKREYNARAEVQERRRETQREAWRKVPAEKKRERSRRLLIRQYGMQPEDFDTMLITQDGKCKICGCVLAPVGTRTHDAPAIDHDHSIGHVRGILCGRCNTGLGQFQDRTDLLRAAINYLERTTNVDCESPLAEAAA